MVKLNSKNKSNYSLTKKKCLIGRIVYRIYVREIEKSHLKTLF